MSDETTQQIACSAEPEFAAWIAQANGTVAISTYQAGKVALVGWNGRQVSINMRHFARPMGMAADARRIALATQHELVLFANAPLLAGDYLQKDAYDALFLPRVSYHTTALNLHDLAWDADDRLWIVNTRFSCLAQLDPLYTFVPKWQPKWISVLAPEDRCHLNGLALVDGRPRYVTALGTTDSPRGWHADRLTGGVLIDIPSNEVVVHGLSMPHSPRWHQGKLWVLNSAQGELCVVDPQRGTREVVCELPGFLRGLSFVGHYALIGMSRVREKYLFEGLPLTRKFPKLRCGAAVVDLRSGRPVGVFEFTQGAEELYDVQFLPGVRRANLLSVDKPAWRLAVAAPEFAYWMPPDRPKDSKPEAIDGETQRAAELEGTAVGAGVAATTGVSGGSGASGEAAD